jgi:predicted metal-dependent HD superfamily phosphohydrolase
MFPIILGFVVALAFEAVAYATYGSAALTDYAWVSMVAWGLIGSGVIVYAITQPMPAWLRRLRALVDARLRVIPTLTSFAGFRR